MTITHIGQTQIMAALIMGAFGFLMPIAVIVIWKLKTRQPLKPFFIGALTFVLFALVLETIPKYPLFITKNPVSEAINASPLLYTLVGCALAGIFEETGRFFAFKTMLKNNKDGRTSVTYGIGHGGIEVMAVLGLMGVQGVVYAIMINSGQFETMVEQTKAVSPANADALLAIPEMINGWDIPYALLCCFERVAAIGMHIGLTIPVFCAARVKGKGWMYPAAIVMHGLMDFPAALYQMKVINQLYVIEIIIAVEIAVVCAAMYKLVYKKYLAGLRDEEPSIVPMNA